MKSRPIILSGIIVIALLSCMGPVLAQGNSPAPVPPDDNLIGPGNPLFGLKIAIENLDETFTVNDTLRLEKQVDHAQTRIEEVQQELILNRTGYADQALELYQEKLNQTEAALPSLQPDANGLLHAQEIITHHQAALADLLARYPGNAGLARAYTNSQILEQKFGEKTRVKFDRIAEKNNTTSFKAVNRETGKRNNTSDTASTGSSGQGRNDTQDRVKDKKTEVPVTPLVTHTQPTPADTRGSSRDQGKKEK